jgi:hypothetical protein
MQLIAKHQTENFLTRHIAQTSDKLSPKLAKYSLDTFKSPEKM